MARVRPATRDDIPRLTRLIERSVRELQRREYTERQIEGALETLFGADRWTQREDDALDPAVDAAKIRAFFVHPGWARRGLGTLLLERCEQAARGAAFRRFELGATLTGVHLYRSRGYREVDRIELRLANGELVPVVRMVKE